MTAPPDFRHNFFELFDLPVGYAVDEEQLSARYRKLQGSLHPDRHAGASAREQRLAVQYSAWVNEAYATLRKPLSRALYLLALAGMTAQDVAGQQIDGSFLIAQMELREKLESLAELVEPDEAIEHLLTELRSDLAREQAQFAAAYGAGDIVAAARVCVRMQYLDKLLVETERVEADLLDR